MLIIIQYLPTNDIFHHKILLSIAVRISKNVLIADNIKKKLNNLLTSENIENNENYSR